MRNDITQQPFILDDCLRLLRNTPRTVAAMVDGLPEAWLTTRDQPGSWNVQEIVGHLVYGEEEGVDWIARLESMVNTDTPEFTPFDREGMLTRYGDTPVPTLASEFSRLRARNIARIEAMALSGNQLEREGIHPEFGLVSCSRLLGAWVTHDLSHVAQIARVLARQYRDVAGPWSKYMPIVNVV